MLTLLVILLLPRFAASGKPPRFSNLKCEILDPSYLAYEKCYLKLLGRGIVALNVHAKLLKGPFYNAKVNLSFWRKFNGFQPFMFNTTFDICKFFRSPKSELSFRTIVYGFVAPSSNLNHTCPYKDEIVVQNLVFKEEFFKFMPLPSGEYQIQIMCATDNHWKTKIYVNILLEEDIIKV